MFARLCLPPSRKWVSPTIYRVGKADPSGSVYTVLHCYGFITDSTNSRTRGQVTCFTFPHHICHSSFFAVGKEEPKLHCQTFMFFFFPECQQGFLCRHLLHKRLRPPIIRDNPLLKLDRSLRFSVSSIAQY